MKTPLRTALLNSIVFWTLAKSVCIGATLTFDSPLLGSLKDANGLGTGFTHRLPGTGANLLENDSNLSLSTHPGRLAIRSTGANINNKKVLELEAPGLFVANVKDKDISISALFRNVNVPSDSDQLMIYVGSSSDRVLRAGVHPKNLYMIVEFEGVSDEVKRGEPDAFAPGDDILISLNRNEGSWTFSWRNLTNPQANGELAPISTPLLDQEQNLYFGITAANASSTNSFLALLDSFTYSVRDRAPSGPVGASAKAQIVNGFVVGVEVLSPGIGYAEVPSVAIVGGGGTGATAKATLEGGVVTGITVTTPGSGYTSSPMLQIQLPPFPSRRAMASVEVVNGFVVGITATDGGFGYDEPPAILFLDDSGKGATATAIISGSMVTGFTITNPGKGYSSSTKILIASPPFTPELNIFVTRVGVTMRVLLGRKYRIESSKDLKTWDAAGSDFLATDESFTQEFEVEETGNFFRLVEVP